MDETTEVPPRYVRRRCCWCDRCYEMPQSLERAYRNCGLSECRRRMREAGCRRRRPRKADLPLLPIRPTRADVVRQLRALTEGGADLGAKIIRTEYPCLSKAIFDCFRGESGGALHAAFRTAGLDPVAVAARHRAEGAAKRIRYPAELIHRAIRERMERGAPVDPPAMRVAGLGALVDAANAREKHGYVAAVVRAGGRPSDCQVHRDWQSSPDAVIAALHERINLGLPMNSGAIQDNDKALFQAACLRFGSWSNALRAVGLDPEQVRRDLEVDIWQGRVYQNIARDILHVVRPQWEPDYVHAYVGSDGAEHRLYPDWRDEESGGWKDAKLNAHGFSARASIDKYTPHTESLEMIVLRGDRLPEGNVLFTSIFAFEADPRAASVAHLFELLRELSASRSRPQRLVRWGWAWDKERIVSAILALPPAQRHSRGAQRHAPKLYNAVQRHVPGGWSAALSLAGLDPNAYRRHRPYLDRDAVDAAVCSAAHEPLRLNQADLARSKGGLRLLNSARHHYGTWSKALIANGVDPKATCRRPART